LADLLLEKEVIFKEDLERIFGERPFDKKEEVMAELSKNTENPKMVKHFTWNCRLLWVRARSSKTIET